LTATFFISLLNPGIGALFAAAFFLLWLNQRSLTYIAVAAASFALTAVGFLIQDRSPALPYDAQIILANLCYLLAASTLAAAVLGRYRVRPPYVLLTALVAIGMAGHLWFLLVEPDLTARIYFINLTLGGLTVYIAAEVLRAEKAHMLDWLLFGALAFAAVNFTLRPLAIMWLYGGFGDPQNFNQSPYWTTSQFAHAMISIVIALNLLVAVAMDLIAKIQRDANTDTLSGLLSRRGFEQDAAIALNRCHMTGTPACLLLADLDNFKQINDGHGHAEGDLVIALVGTHIREQIGHGAVAGRIGGEEFAILLTGVELGAARARAEAIRAGLPLYCAGKLPSGLVPTASIGMRIATPGTDLSSLLSEADAALYVAKARGRNQVQVFTPGKLAGALPAATQVPA
jgi:diguanylate cyclase (GGDEF)-like protein